MPAARAKLLLQQDIATPEALLALVATPDVLAKWLVASLPYSERDVLDLVTPSLAGPGPMHQEKDASPQKANSHERARSQVYQRARRLAQCILARAEAHVAEDMRRAQNLRC
jgi:hypothetical protein